MKKKAIVFIERHGLSLFYLVLSLGIAVITGIEFYDFRTSEVEFVTGEGVVDIQHLSDYFSPLEGTIGDAEIYVLGTQDPEEPSIMLLGGIHPNEPAGQLATVALMENLVVEHGTVYIILEANRSAYTHSQPQEATPEYYSIETPFGERRFKYGSRATNPIDQWPVPEIYVHQSTGQRLSGVDTRNLNRSFPGKPDGNYTEQVAYAIRESIVENDIIMTLDFHEASPEYAVNNALVYHEKVKSTGIAAQTILNLELFWLSEDERFAPIKPEVSPVNLRGLSHRELGDDTRTLAFLTETSNASQGRIRGKTTTSLIVDDGDKFYERATELGILEVDHSDPVTMDERVGRHIEVFLSLIDAYNVKQAGFSGDNLYYQRGTFEIDANGLGFTEIMDHGIGQFLQDPDE
ncbi:MAG: succinylglutamate desuccinylase [Acholeplasmataceae bacterium]